MTEREWQKCLSLKKKFSRKWCLLISILHNFIALLACAAYVCSEWTHFLLLSSGNSSAGHRLLPVGPEATVESWEIPPSPQITTSGEETEVSVYWPDLVTSTLSEVKQSPNDIILRHFCSTAEIWFMPCNLYPHHWFTYHQSDSMRNLP